MTKILLIEKRYDGAEKTPSVTAKWVDLPDGGEDLFLIEQLKDINKVEELDEEEIEVETQERIINTPISDALVRLSTPISLLALAIAVAYNIFCQTP